MLTIRLTRKGKKNQPFFRVVVIDKRRSSKGGRAVEILGYIDPLTKKKSLKKERILHWISKGAQPSPTMHNMLVSEKIIDAKKINVFKKSKKAAEATAAVPAATGEIVPAAEAPVPAEKAPEEVKLAPEAPKAEEPSSSASPSNKASDEHNKATEDKKA